MRAEFGAMYQSAVAELMEMFSRRSSRLKAHILRLENALYGATASLKLMRLHCFAGADGSAPIGTVLARAAHDGAHTTAGAWARDEETVAAMASTGADCAGSSPWDGPELLTWLQLDTRRQWVRQDVELDVIIRRLWAALVHPNRPYSPRVHRLFRRMHTMLQRMQHTPASYVPWMMRGAQSMLRSTYSFTAPPPPRAPGVGWGVADAVNGSEERFSLDFGAADGEDVFDGESQGRIARDCEDDSAESSDSAGNRVADGPAVEATNSPSPAPSPSAAVGSEDSVGAAGARGSDSAVVRFHTMHRHSAPMRRASVATTLAAVPE